MNTKLVVTYLFGLISKGSTWSTFYRDVVVPDLHKINLLIFTLL